MARRLMKVVEPGGFKLGAVQFFEGETASFEDAEADTYRDLGWLAEEDGTTGTRVPGSVRLDVKANRAASSGTAE